MDDFKLLPGEIDERLARLDEQAKKARVLHGRLETQLRKIQEQSEKDQVRARPMNVLFLVFVLRRFPFMLAGSR